MHVLSDLRHRIWSFPCIADLLAVARSDWSENGEGRARAMILHDGLAVFASRPLPWQELSGSAGAKLASLHCSESIPDSAKEIRREGRQTTAQAKKADKEKMDTKLQGGLEAGAGRQRLLLNLEIIGLESAHVRAQESDRVRRVFSELCGGDSCACAVAKARRKPCRPAGHPG